MTETEHLNRTSKPVVEPSAGDRLDGWFCRGRYPSIMVYLFMGGATIVFTFAALGLLMSVIDGSTEGSLSSFFVMSLAAVTFWWCERISTNSGIERRSEQVLPQSRTAMAERTNVVSKAQDGDKRSK